MSIRKKTRVKDGRKETFYEVFVSGKDNLGNRKQFRRYVENRKKAERVELQLRKELEELQEKGPKKTFSQFLQDYLEYLELHKRKSQATIRSERSSLENHALPVIGKLYLGEIKPAHIELIVNEKMLSKATQTRRHCLNYLRAMFSLAIKRNLVIKNPCNDIVGPKVIRKAPTILTGEQISVFLDAVRMHAPHYLTHCLLALHCTLRASEIRGLTFGAIDWEQNMIAIRQIWTVKGGLKLNTKTNLERTIPMSLELREYLLQIKRRLNPKPTDWVAERHKEFMRDEQSKVVKEVCRLAGLPPCTFHNLRSAAITNFYREGLSTPDIMILSGHQRLSSTQKYFTLSGKQVQGVTKNISFMKNREDSE